MHILIQECLQHNRKSQEQLYSQFSPVIFGLCRRYFSDYDEAQDSLQETFITVFQKLNQFEGKGSFEGWIKRIAVNTCVQKLRNTAFNVVLEDIADHQIIEEPNQEIENATVAQLMEGLQHMPDRYRMVFNLYVVEEYSHKDIADMLDITVGTSKSNLSRAKEWLTKHIKKNTNFNLKVYAK